MINTLLGIKKNMTSGYDARGRRTGITVVEIKPNFVTQVKTADGKDGYDAIQLGTGSKKSVKKPQIGHAKKAGIEAKIRWFKEVKQQATGDNEQSEEIKPGQEMSKLSPGQEIKLDQVFSVGDSIKITGTSKGKGFQGGVRRHGFHGGPKTRGQSDRHRAPGSIGSGTTPGRVLKGKRMAGHMGVETSSVRNLEVVAINKKENLLMVKGAVPGFTGGLIEITKLGRIKGYTPPPEEKEEEPSEAEAVDGKEEPKQDDQVVDKSAETAEIAEAPKEEGGENAG
jgi:large subunit ribosomal protein L3